MESDVIALKAYIHVLETLTSAIWEQEKQMVKYLVQTPGVYLLSVPGISVTYAADFTAEVGDIHQFAYAGQVISLAGTASISQENWTRQTFILPTRGRTLSA
jgi:transposase